MEQETVIERDPLVRFTDRLRDAMIKEKIFHATYFSRPWASNDVIFVVGEQRFYVHRWILTWWSPVFDKMFSSNFAEKTKTEIALPGKKSVEFQELMLMVYSLAERAMTIENCFFLLKLGDEYQMEFLLQRCEDFLVAASGSICTGRLSIHEFFTDFFATAIQTREGTSLGVDNNCAGIQAEQAFISLLTRSSLFQPDRTQKGI